MLSVIVGNEKESLEKGQVDLHLHWLHSLGFAVEFLTVGAWIKCRGKDEVCMSGAFAYRTWENRLHSEGIALSSMAKVHGQEYKYKTLPDQSFSRLSPSAYHHFDEQKRPAQSIENLARIEAVWNKSVSVGTSPYLSRKGVGAYGVRFRSTSRFGTAVVIPMRNVHHLLKGVQYINADGNKRILAGSVMKGSFHLIGEFHSQGMLLLAEGYATGAFLYEATSLPVCVCFAACNLMSVAASLRQAYPSLAMIFAADNDRHLPVNEGVQAATKAARAVKGYVIVPDFGGSAAFKNASDWLDLAYVNGREVAIGQLVAMMSKISVRRPSTFSGYADYSGKGMA